VGDQHDLAIAAVVITGAPAAGKTVLGAAVARRMRAALLDMDTLTAPLTAVVAELSGTDDLDSPRLAELTRSARYRSLFRTAVDVLSVGTPVVLVAPFTAERESVSAWDGARSWLGRGAVLVWVHVPGEELLRRLRGRDAARDRAKIADPAKFLREVALSAPVVDHIAVDGALPVEQQVEAVLTGRLTPGRVAGEPAG
jgi:predicted kinase